MIEDGGTALGHTEKTVKQLRANYHSRIKKDLNGFTWFESFSTWYKEAPKSCYYCGLMEEQSQKLVRNGILTSNRFPQNGITSRGKARGMWLEVDRLKPKGPYSIENCVLACYFCNNDKSDVFHGDDYKLFFQNRREYLNQLLSSKNDNRYGI